MTSKGMDVFPTAAIPKSHRLVEGGAGEPAAIWRERHLVHDLLVPSHAATGRFRDLKSDT